MSIGEGVLTQQKKKAVETFIWKLYNLDLESVDEVRVVLFFKALPPTSDALSLHTIRAHYQTLIWKQAHCLEPLLPDPVTLGWSRTDDNKLRPVLMTQDPIPKACVEIISCSCRTGCATCRCGCKKACSSQVFVGARKLPTQTVVKIPTLNKTTFKKDIPLETYFRTKNSDKEVYTTNGKRPSNRSGDMNCSYATLLFFYFCSNVNIHNQ